ncbi:M1-specific T cell receptor beta chain-like [Vanacampus margaritifer]
MIALLILILQQTEAAAEDTTTVHQTPPFIIKRVGERTANELSCSHSITDYDVILWYKQGRGNTMEFLGYLNQNFPEIESHLTGKVDFTGNGRQQSELTIDNLTLNDSAVYFCAASTGNVNVQYSVAYFGPGTKLTVLEPGRNPTPPAVTLLPPSPKECHNHKDKQRFKKTLVCAATGFFPDHVGISWQVAGQSVTTGVATDANALRDGAFYKMTSRLRVAADLWFMPGRAFTCTVSFFDGKNTTLHSKTVYGIQADGKVTRVTYLRVAQSAKLSYAVILVKSSVYASFVGFLLWKRQGQIAKLNPT